MEMYKEIPVNMMESINNYVYKGQKLGGFLSAIFANDLIGAIKRADKTNSKLISIYALYVYHETPARCNGSYEIMDEYYKSFMKKKEKDE